MIANTQALVVVKRIQLYVTLIAILSLTLGTIIMNTEAQAGVIRCSTVTACATNKTDYLMMVANDLYNNSYIDSLANHRASFNGCNIAIVNVENMTGFPFDTLGIRDFIKAVYETQRGTVIRYQMSHSGYPVTFRFYNLLGDEVRRLVDQELELGNYSVRWDGRNNEGKEVVTGVYFYELRIGNLKQLKKLILLR